MKETGQILLTHEHIRGVTTGDAVPDTRLVGEHDHAGRVTTILAPHARTAEDLAREPKAALVAR